MSRKKPLQNRYCLRYAGGVYWLLDCEQDGAPYREPVPMNEAGADIWRLLEQGQSEEEVVECISTGYLADKDVVRQDVKQFMNCLFETAGEISNEYFVDRRFGKSDK